MPCCLLVPVGVGKWWLGTVALRDEELELGEGLFEFDIGWFVPVVKLC